MITKLLTKKIFDFSTFFNNYQLIFEKLKDQERSEMDATETKTKIFIENELKPISTAERIELLDVLRGIAICGILFGNIPIFMGYYYMNSVQKAALPFDFANHVTIFLTHIFIEGKFYSLFSLLFGIGFSIQLMRAGSKEINFLPFYTRRLFFLLLIGLVHLIFLWTGDILSVYAITGFVLLLFRNTSSKTLLALAILLLILPVFQYAIILFTESKLHPGTPFDLGARYISNVLPLKSESRLEALEGDYISWLSKNITGAFYRFSNLFYTGRPFKVLAMFLIGFYIGKQKILNNLSQHNSTLRKIMITGLLVGIPFNIALAWLMEKGEDYPPSMLGLYQSIIYLISVVPMALAIASFVAIAWQKPSWQQRLSLFSPIGKMGLSNYLLQTILCLFIYNGFGLGLAGKAGPFVSLGIVFLILFFQLQFSKWWLSKFQFGPVEWLWRSLTYGKVQKLKIRNN